MKTPAVSAAGRVARLLVGVSLLATLAPASAHKASDAYLRIEVRGDVIEQRTDIALRDLDREVVLDADDDGQLTWGEVRARWPQVEQLAQANISLQADGQPCQAGAAGPAQLERHSDGRYAVLTRRWRCAAPVDDLGVAYALFAGSDPTHRGILSLGHDGSTRSAVLVPGAGVQHFRILGGAAAASAATPGGTDTPGSFAGFVAEGVHHILIGTDHVLFLLALLLPAVLVPISPGPGGALAPVRGDLLADRRRRHSLARTGLRADGPALAALPVGATTAASLPWRPARGHDTGWSAAPSFGPVLMDVAKVVTAFTLAHSITLALAVLGIVNPPSRVVESVIAATVAIAAIDNLLHFLPRERWKLTFVFGLVHGFGFASALQDLGLVRETLASSLLGFNLGVEIGQLGIVALFLPLAWWSRRSPFYRRVVLGAGSVVIAAAALVWLVERAAGLTLLG